MKEFPRKAIKHQLYQDIRREALKKPKYNIVLSARFFQIPSIYLSLMWQDFPLFNVSLMHRVKFTIAPLHHLPNLPLIHLMLSPACFFQLKISTLFEGATMCIVWHHT